MVVPTQAPGALYCVFRTVAMSSAWLSQCQNRGDSPLSLLPLSPDPHLRDRNLTHPFLSSGLRWSIGFKWM